MKCLLVVLSLAMPVMVVQTGPAAAKGCIKGAIVGGIAGKMAGHGKVGAAAGCAIGHHEANKPPSGGSNPQAQPANQQR